MRIAIDARELAGKPTGVGRYLASLLAAWARMPQAAAHEFVLCAPDPVDLSGLEALQASAATAGGHGTVWEQTALPRLVRRARADVLFAPAYTGPLACPVPMVLTIHDVSFAAHPEWFSWREGLRRRLLTRLSARRASRVLTVSDFSKDEIVARLGVEETRVDVIYHGTTSLPVADAVPREPMVLYVGSLFARRHIEELVAGFAALARRRPDVVLEIVGDNRTTPPVDIERLASAAGAAGRVRWRSYVPDDELARLYARAAGFAFLSDYEGFGMTPLEALAAGIPIVVLDTDVAREIYGPAAVYVPHPAPGPIEEALERVLFDEATRGHVLAAAPQVLARYSWDECAHRTLQALVAAAPHHG